MRIRTKLKLMCKFLSIHGKVGFITIILGWHKNNVCIYEMLLSHCFLNMFHGILILGKALTYIR